MPTGNEARAHHYVPQCWLAGFTDSGEQDGRLWVTDLKRRKQWQSNPENTGHRRDFYRVEDPSVADPLAIENLFSDIETIIGPIFKTLNKEKRGPQDGYELGALVEYMAIQWVRVPTFRALIGRTMFTHFSEDLLSSRESWANALRNAAIPANHPDADYESVLQAVRSGHITYTADPTFFLKHSVNVVREIGECLMKLRWGWLVSQNGQFIGFDSPVALDGKKDQPLGFKNPGIVVYPVSRHVLLYGLTENINAPVVTTKLIAHQNSFAMLSADEQVYSHRPDFHWLDESGKCQNKWELFSNENFVRV